MNGLLKFITCGSVDDGKSTLIGHMLYDAKLLFTDQEQALLLESRVGSREGKVDYSLLLDGLMAEREQGITIDVAYRYFTTERRSFIVADTPGHEEYTRNMAVILVDASRGILPQTRRHARICALMGIRYFLFAVNKMDLIRYGREEYRRLEKELRKLAIDLELANVELIPVSATEGDNLTSLSPNMPWYKGATFLEYLETVDTACEEKEQGFILPVQRVCRPNHTFRGFQGQIEAGEIRAGEEITVLPSREKACVEAVYAGDQKTDRGEKGQAVTLTLDREIDVSRGCVLVKDARLTVGGLLTATVLWMDDEELRQGKNFLMKLGTKRVPVTVMEIKYRTDMQTGEHLAADSLYKNELAVCDLAAAEEIVYDTFVGCRELGSFILIDRVTNLTSACGVVEHPLWRGANLTWQRMDITREMRAAGLGQKPLTLWFTGLSGSGKSALANELEKRLNVMGKHTMLLDGDNIRLGLNRNLGFEPEDRIENIRRIAEVAKLMNDAGLIVLTAFISPFRSDRENAGRIIGEDSFIEIYVSTPLEECERRDVKGLYRKARSGEIPNFTGISSPYEAPEHAALVIDTSKRTLEEAAEQVLAALERRIHGKEA